MCHELDACLETPVKFRSDYDFSSISMEFGLYCDKKKDEANPDIHDGWASCRGSYLKFSVRSRTPQTQYFICAHRQWSCLQESAVSAAGSGIIVPLSLLVWLSLSGALAHRR
jgi:hypothetical protein